VQFTGGEEESNGPTANKVRIVDNLPSNTLFTCGSLSLCVDASPPATCTTHSRHTLYRQFDWHA
jgi:hypothetical protein